MFSLFSNCILELRRKRKDSSVVRHPLSFPFPSWVESSKDQTAVYAQVAQEIGEEQKSLCTNVSHNFMSTKSSESWISHPCPVLLLKRFWLCLVSVENLQRSEGIIPLYMFLRTTLCSWKVWLEVICFSQQKVAFWCFSQLGCLPISLLMRTLMNSHLWFYPWTQPNSVVNFPYVWMGDSFSYPNSRDISVSNIGGNQNEKWKEKWMSWEKCYNLMLWLSFRFASQR